MMILCPSPFTDGSKVLQTLGRAVTVRLINSSKVLVSSEYLFIVFLATELGWFFRACITKGKFWPVG